MPINFLILLATAFLVGMALGIGLVLLLGLEEKPRSAKWGEPRIRPEFPIHWEDYDD